MYKNLQKLGSSLMLPVSVLVVAALFMAIGYGLDPQALAGSDNSIAVFLVQAGLVVIDNLPILFAVGVAVGFAGDNNGTAGLAGLVSFLMITTLLNPEKLAVIQNVPVEEINPAFDAVKNVFIGIISGVTAGWAYNRFHKTELPQWLAFFSGRRSVAIVTAMVSVLIAIILYFIWPALYGLLTALGTSIAGLGALGAGLFGFLNRLLIPTGLHHALNNIFWFDTIGINDIGNFWASTGTEGVTGMYQAGFFPIMMFGLPAAAMAMIKNAKPELKGQAKALLIAGAIASFATGITEPLEFSFMFAAPLLYFVHALLTGASLFVASTLNATAGFSFSAGLIDLIASWRMPLANNTWMLLAMGLVFAVLYFIIFDWMIKHFDLNTPGRGKVLEHDASTDEMSNTTGPTDHNPTGTMRPNEVMAYEIYQAIGGSENIQTVNNCATRLRLGLNDTSIIDQARIQAAGVSGVRVLDGKNLQVIIGPKVQFVADELSQMNRQRVTVHSSPQNNEAQIKHTEVSQESKQTETQRIVSPLTGEIIQLADVEDPAFSSKALGEGLAVKPLEGQIVSPVNGEVMTVFPTKHAIGFKAENGAELLMHMGLNTVELNGQGFQIDVNEGDKVSMGDYLGTIDIELIADQGYSLVTPLVVTNGGDFNIVNINQGDHVSAGDSVYEIDVK